MACRLRLLSKYHLLMINRFKNESLSDNSVAVAICINNMY